MNAALKTPKHGRGSSLWAPELHKSILNTDAALSTREDADNMHISDHTLQGAPDL